MGNYISCTFLSPAMKKNSVVARVIFPGGEIRQFREPVKAAELMLDCPSFFLVNSRALSIGRRFSALAADDDLEFGHWYIMFPMKRVNSVVTAADVAVFFMSANSAAKRISGGNVRVSPESGGVNHNPAAVAAIEGGSPGSGAGGSKLSFDDDVEGFPVAEFKFRLSACRSRKPMLDTITEEPLCSR